jgi:hypothetical protein
MIWNAAIYSTLVVQNIVIVGSAEPWLISHGQNAIAYWARPSLGLAARLIRLQRSRGRGRTPSRGANSAAEPIVLFFGTAHESARHIAHITPVKHQHIGGVALQLTVKSASDIALVKDGISLHVGLNLR